MAVENYPALSDKKPPLVATIMAPWLTSGYGGASTGGGTTSMSLRRNCLLWQCTKAVLQALPLVEAV